MSNTTRVSVVVALLVVIGVTMAFKQREKSTSPTQDQPSTSIASRPADGQGVLASRSTMEKMLPRLVDLGAGKCIPCKKMAPILENLKKEFSGQLDVEFIDVWENPDAGSRYKINLIPTQIFYDTAGKELFRHEGFYSREDILAKWKDLGVDLADKSSITISTETRN